MKLRSFQRGELSLPSHVRDFNRAAVLQRLFRQGPLSRADLARQIGLTKVTISALVSALVAEGVLEEGEAHLRPGVPGKRPTMVAISETQRRIVAVDIARDGRLIGATMTLTGEFVDQLRVDEPLPPGDAGVDRLTEFSRSLTDLAGMPVIGFGISAPGVVTLDGKVLRALKLGWHDLDLQGILSARLGLPVTVANDANCACLGEYAFSETEGHSVLTLLVGDGIGGGLVLGGALALGAKSAAGEIAHLPATTRGDGGPWGEPVTCICGRVGCLETLLSESTLRSSVDGLEPQQRTQWLTEVGKRLGSVLAPITAALDLSDIALAGPPDLLEGPLIDSTRETLDQALWSEINNAPRLRVSQLKDRAPLVGAGALILSSTLGIP